MALYPKNVVALIAICCCFVRFQASESEPVQSNNSNLVSGTTEASRSRKDLGWLIPRNDPCGLGKEFVKDIGKCLLQRHLGEPCRHTDQCRQFTRNAVCGYASDSDDIMKCMCPDTHFSNDQDNCFVKKPCEQSKESQPHYKDRNPRQGNCSANEVCLDIGYCWCPKDYYWGMNYKCVPKLSNHNHATKTTTTSKPISKLSSIVTSTIPTASPSTVSPVRIVDQFIAENRQLKLSHAQLEKQIKDCNLDLQPEPKKATSKEDTIATCEPSCINHVFITVIAFVCLFGVMCGIIWLYQYRFFHCKTCKRKVQNQDTNNAGTELQSLNSK